jgi:hypothetical protein
MKRRGKRKEKREKEKFERNLGKQGQRTRKWKNK